jgi:hypothetical protein
MLQLADRRSPDRIDESENAIRLRTHVLAPHFEIARRAEHFPSVAYDTAHLKFHA